MRKYLWLYCNAMGSDQWGVTTSKEDAIVLAREMLALEVNPGFGDESWTWEFHKAPRRVTVDHHQVVLDTSRNDYSIEHHASVHRLHVLRDRGASWLLRDPVTRETFIVRKSDVNSTPGLSLVTAV